MSFLSKVVQKLGSKTPIEGGILLFSGIQLSALSFIAGLLKILTGQKIDQIIYLGVGIIILVFNTFFLSEKRWVFVRKHPFTGMTKFEAVIGIGAWFFTALLIMYLIIPIAQLINN